MYECDKLHTLNGSLTGAGLDGFLQGDLRMPTHLVLLTPASDIALYEMQQWFGDCCAVYVYLLKIPLCVF